MPKAGRKRHLEYSPHLITYIDILGFRDLVEHKSPDFISRAIRRVTEATAPDNEFRERNQENYVKFSDLIVHTVPVFSASNEKFRDGIVFQEIFSLAAAQVSLVYDGLLLRGAMTIGLLERTYGVLFGPGIITAHDLERKVARFPRIVLDPILVEALKVAPLLRAHPYKEEIKHISNLVKKDGAGTVFIDYLGSMDGEGAEPEDYPDFLRIHKRLVESGIRGFRRNKRVLSKYLWLKKYHNAVVRARFKRDYWDDLLVHGTDARAAVQPFLFALK